MTGPPHAPAKHAAMQYSIHRMPERRRRQAAPGQPSRSGRRAFRKHRFDGLAVMQEAFLIGARTQVKTCCKPDGNDGQQCKQDGFETDTDMHTV